MQPRRRVVLSGALAMMAFAGCGSVALSPDGASSGDGPPADHVGAAGLTGNGGTTGTAGMTGNGGTTGTAGASGQGGHDGSCPGVCAIFCPFGNVPDANGCPTCGCNPPPVCTTAECGAPPPFAQPVCLSGQITPASCDRASDGTCAWSPPTCKVGCPATSCAQSCPYGSQTDASGCSTCSCNLCPTGTHHVTCAQAMCALACPGSSFVHGADGCATCACRPVATCAPGSVCASCPFGTRTGPNGCRSCACQDPPAGCALDATGST